MENICSRCGQVKEDEDCTGVEFGCPADNPEKACPGWYGMCCYCGYEYGLGQM